MLIKNDVSSAIRKAQIEYFKEKLDNISGNSSAFWKLMKLVLPLKRATGEIEKIIVNKKQKLIQFTKASSLLIAIV